ANSGRSSIAIQDQIGDTHQATYSPNARSVSFIDRSGAMQQWKATTGARESVLYELPNPGSIYSIAFSADGNRIAVGCRDGPVRLWDRSTGAAGPVLEGHSNVVDVLAFSPCGCWIASYDFDKLVRLWDLRDTKQQCVLVENLEDWISGLKFSPTVHQLAICSRTGKIRIFDPRTRILLTSKTLVEGGIRVLDYSPNGQQLALGTKTSIALWDLQSDEPHLELKVPPTREYFSKSMTISYSPCGQFLAFTDADCILHLWHRQLDEGNTDSWSYAFALRGCHGFIKNISWNPVLPIEFMTSSEDGSVRVWRVSSDDERILAVKMLWGTNIRTLCTADVVLKGATGLSPIHRKLLVQRGAIDNNLSPGDDESDKAE
ncbi:WD repeat-containing protein 90, partial [Linnemannia elongata]